MSETVPYDDYKSPAKDCLNELVSVLVRLYDVGASVGGTDGEYLRSFTAHLVLAKHAPPCCWTVCEFNADTYKKQRDRLAQLGPIPHRIEHVPKDIFEWLAAAVSAGRAPLFCDLDLMIDQLNNKQIETLDRWVRAESRAAFVLVLPMRTPHRKKFWPRFQ